MHSNQNWGLRLLSKSMVGEERKGLLRFTDESPVNSAKELPTWSKIHCGSDGVSDSTLNQPVVASITDQSFSGITISGTLRGLNTVSI